jgi:hypothetical protein
MGRECSKNGEDTNAYRTLVGKPEGNKLPVMPNVGGKVT